MQASLYSLLVKREYAHEDVIYCCAWTRLNLSENPSDPPREVIVTGGALGEIKVWEWECSKLKFQDTLQEHTMAITSLSFSNDGKTLVSTAMDFKLIVWDILAGRSVHTIPAPQVWRATFAPDGAHIVAGCHTGDLVVYNVVKGSVLNVMDTREQFAIAVAWAANEKLIACGSTTGAVCVLDSDHGKVIHTFKDHKDSVKDITFSPNSKLLLTGSSDLTVKLYDVVAGALLHSFDQTSGALAVSFCPDGKRVALGTGDGEVIIALIDTPKGQKTPKLQVLKTFKEHYEMVWQVHFNLKGDLLMSVSKDRTINIFEIPPIITAKKT